MATAHFASTTYKRSSDKAGAAQRIQYIQREGVYHPDHVPARAKVEHLTLEKTFGEKLRADLIETDVGNLPSWARGDKGDAITFFTAAEKYEGANRTTYHEWKFALPRELNRTEQMAAAKDMMNMHFGTTRPHVWAMHEPGAADGGKNAHIHVIWSSRMYDGIDRTPETFFKKHDAAHPGRGGARKAKDNTLNNIKDWRRTYTDVMNLHLERAGVEARLHPDSHRARGLERAPEPHVLPSDSNAAKFDGKTTEGWDKVLKSRAERPAYEQAEHLDAQLYWERRKEDLGLTPTMPLDQARDRIAQGRTVRTTARLTPSDRAREVARLAALAKLSDHITLEQRRQRIADMRGHRRESTEAENLIAEGVRLRITPRRVPTHRPASLTTQVERFARALDADAGTPHGTHARILRDEKERDNGYER